MAPVEKLGSVSQAIQAVRQGIDPQRNMQILHNFVHSRMAAALGRSYRCGPEEADDHINDALLWAWIKLAGVDLPRNKTKVSPDSAPLADVYNRRAFLDALILKARDYRRDARKKQQRSGRDGVIPEADLGDSSAPINLLAQALVTQLTPDETAEVNEIVAHLRQSLSGHILDEMDRTIAHDFLLTETDRTREAFCDENQISDQELTLRIKRIITRLRKLPIELS